MPKSPDSKTELPEEKKLEPLGIPLNPGSQFFSGNSGLAVPERGVRGSAWPAPLVSIGVICSDLAVIWQLFTVSYSDLEVICSHLAVMCSDFAVVCSDLAVILQ